MQKSFLLNWQLSRSSFLNKKLKTVFEKPLDDFCIVWPFDAERSLNDGSDVDSDFMEPLALESRFMVTVRVRGCFPTQTSDPKKHNESYEFSTNPAPPTDIAANWSSLLFWGLLSTLRNPAVATFALITKPAICDHFDGNNVRCSNATLDYSQGT